MNAVRTPALSPSQALQPALAAGILYLLFVGGYVLAFGGDVSCLVCASRDGIGREPFEKIRRGFDKPGYDGQFYYVIARQPFRSQREHVDFPSYRHARVLYPALAYLLSGGDPYLLLWAMPLLNLLAVLGLTWLGTKIALHYDRSPWWGLVLSIGVNAFMPAMRNLTDPLAAVTVVGLLVAWLLRWPTWLLIGWGIASILSREQNIAVAAIIGLEALIAREWRRSAGLVLVGAAWAGWMYALKSAYGAWPVSPSNVSAPLTGLLHAWTHLAKPDGGVSLPNILRMLLLSAALLAAPVVLLRGDRIARFVTLTGAALAVMGGIAIYDDQWGYMRVLNGLPLGLWLYAMQNGRRWPARLLAPALLWPALETYYVWKTLAM